MKLIRRATLEQNKNIEKAIKIILEEIGEDLNRDGLLDTPKRVSKSLREILCGYNANIEEIMSKRFKLTTESNNIVKVNSINFYSLCEHHLLPFWGHVNIEYVPKSEVLGLSKFARLVDSFSRRLQIQENLTNQIGKTIIKYLKCDYVKVYIKAYHMCMIMRGVSKSDSFTETEFIYKI